MSMRAGKGVLAANDKFMPRRFDHDYRQLTARGVLARVIGVLGRILGLTLVSLPEGSVGARAESQTWHRQAVPSDAQDLIGDSCPSKLDCFAVGWSDSSGTPSAPHHCHHRRRITVERSGRPVGSSATQRHLVRIDARLHRSGLLRRRPRLLTRRRGHDRWGLDMDSSSGSHGILRAECCVLSEQFRLRRSRKYQFVRRGWHHDHGWRTDLDG